MAAKRNKTRRPESPAVGSRESPAGAAPDAARKPSPIRSSGDSGLSLDQLSAAFAQMLGAGADPYTAPVEPRDREESLATAALALTAPEDEPDDSAHDACEITPQSIIEALLFVGSPAGEGISSAQLAGLMRGVRPAEVDAAVSELNERYAARGAPYAIVDVAGGYRMAVREEFDRLRDKFYGRIRRARLSQSAIEVLSLVAYNEPISGDEINRLRGAHSGAILTQLLRRELLRLDRAPEAKRGLYSTTPRFLAVFGLESLGDLPKSTEGPA